MMPKIFIVDDDIDELIFYYNAFEKEDFKADLSFFRNPEGLIPHLDGLLPNEFPNLIVSDLNMPKLTGYQLLNNLKSSTQQYSIGSGQAGVTYAWTVPKGWTITAGQGTATITVSVGGKVSSGLSISVLASNTCGTSFGSLTVNATPSCSLVMNASQEPAQQQSVTLPMSLEAYPNPTHGQFTVKIQSGNTVDAISIIVYGINGNAVETRSNLKAGQTLQLGALYIPGVYMIEMIQGKEHKQLKLVKIPN